MTKPYATYRKATLLLGMALAMLVCFAVVVPVAQAEIALEKPRVVGHQKCVDCHELPVEAWKNSQHSQKTLEMLGSNLRASRYANRLGLNADSLEQEATCLECHATHEKTDEGTLRVLGGVSCESCHGAAGPSSLHKGWLDYHCGEESLPEGVDADLDTYLKNTGMARTEDIYQLALRCYTCHSVSNEKVVQAGHVAGTHEFEIVSWFAGEVRHNFAPYTCDVEDCEDNACASNMWLAKHEAKPRARQRLMYVAGVLADLEVNLRNRAKASEAGTFATAAAGRSVAAFVQLQQISKKLDASELSMLIRDLEDIQDVLFLVPNAEDAVILTEAADRVGQQARKFIAKHQEDDLSALEPLMTNEIKGQIYQP